MSQNPQKTKAVLDYHSSGVDIKAGDALVSWIAQQDRVPHPLKHLPVSGVGGFASLFRLPTGYKKPCLVSATDGVGTKVQLAKIFSDYTVVGQDLVAMCVNDLVCCGATPLFFLDYYASGKLELPVAKAFITGVQKACLASGCALTGGETAEMPGVYRPGDFDCAGFAVGVVEEDEVWGAHKVSPGDEVWAVASSGPHSNGYSLIRKLFSDDIQSFPALYQPTKLYAPFIKALSEASCDVRSVAHITGGGLDNLLRALPKGVCAPLDLWTFPEIFQIIQKRSGLHTKQMLQTFNCGVGLVVVLPPSEGKKISDIAKASGHKAFPISVLQKSEETTWEIN